MEAAIAPPDWFINNKLYMITGADDAMHYICSFLNSKLFTKIILQSANFSGGKGVNFLSLIKLPHLNEYKNKDYTDEFFSVIFNLNDIERDFISFQ